MVEPASMVHLHTAVDVHIPTVDNDVNLSQLLLVNYFSSKNIFFNLFTLAPCDSNPCINSGVCNVVGSTYTCTCPPGYTGSTCETNIRPGKNCTNLSLDYLYHFS
jgi:hypothetical protein